MSDYLTNLVSRSFSSLAPVQPETASLSAAPEGFESSLEKFSDPFAEAENSSDEDSAPTEDLDRSKRPEDNPRYPEASLRDSPRLDQTSIAAPLPRRSDAITPVQREATPSTAEVLGRSNQPESRPTHKQARRKTESIAPPIINVNLPSSVRPPDLKPIQETSAEPVVNSGPIKTKAFETENFKETPTVSSGIAPLIKSVQEVDINRSTRSSKPLDSDKSAQQLQKKPGQLSPQTLAASLIKPISAAGDESRRHRVSESVAASDDKQARNSPSTLTPKVQPSLPITVDRGPNAAVGQVAFEPATQPLLTETIVNVAIGRIEVRATSVESPKREQHARGPKVMNLDDYMQQRSRGNR